MLMIDMIEEPNDENDYIYKYSNYIDNDTNKINFYSKQELRDKLNGLYGSIVINDILDDTK